jgi:hypothetical protein
VTVYVNTLISFSLFIPHHYSRWRFPPDTVLLLLSRLTLLIIITDNDDGTPEQDSRTPYPPILPHHLGHSPRGSRIPNSRRGMVHLRPNERVGCGSLLFSCLPDLQPILDPLCFARLVSTVP